MTWPDFFFGGKHLPFWAFSIRAVLLYLALVAATRLMGHRQVGILSGHNYLVAAGIVSVAALRMVNPESSLIAGLVIVGLYAGINLLLSKLDLRWPLLIDREPISLIVDGQLRPENLRKARITVEELLALLRVSGCLRISDAWQAILEPTGKLGIVKTATASPVSRQDFGLGPIPVGASVVVMKEGQVKRQGLLALQRDTVWLFTSLQQRGVTNFNQVALALGEPDGTLSIIPKGS